MGARRVDVRLCVVVAVWAVLFPSRARAEFCWAYSQGPSLSPIECREIGDTSQPCSSDGGGSSCFYDGLTDLPHCCTTLPSPPNTKQTIEEQHANWHNCFGAIGNTSLPPAGMIFSGQLNPPGRGARWYAFHRQFLIDFDLFRGAAPQGKDSPLRIEWVPWGRDKNGNPKRLTHDFPSNPDPAKPTICSGTSNAVWRRGTELDPLGGPPCPLCENYPECLNFRPGAQTGTGQCTSLDFGDEATLGFRRRTTDGRVAICFTDPVSHTSDCRYTDTGTSVPSSDTLEELKSIDQFTDVEQVTDMLDAYFHGKMHGAVQNTGAGFCSLPPYQSCTADTTCTRVGPCVAGTCKNQVLGKDVDCNSDADCGVCMTNGKTYCQDVGGSDHSVRDPEFWRLHKSLDVVVQAWQRTKGVDVVVVLDRSGSMSETDKKQVRKYDRAVEAAKMFADVFRDPQTTNSSNFGVVVYSDNAMRVLELQPASTIDPNALEAQLNAIQPSGCTGIGQALLEASKMMCGPNGCVNPGARRRGIVLLTDGIENVPPCLFDDSATGSSGTCGSTCNGGPDKIYEALGDAQVCAIGFGENAQVSGDKLTLLAERQGGIYYHTPSTDPGTTPQTGSFRDLKVVFAKCLGLVSPEAEQLDPQGIMAPGQLAGDGVPFNICDETGITAITGWNNPVAQGGDDGIASLASTSASPPNPLGLRVLVNAPNGDLVQSSRPGVQTSIQSTWSFQRIGLPYAGQQTGLWRAQIIRSHLAYVNGFTTDSLPIAVATPLVRREIQRVCPDGCASVLYFEDETRGAQSSYEDALAAEQQAGLLGSVTRATDANDLNAKLAAQTWDLIVYAHQSNDHLETDEPYDTALKTALCGEQRSIVTETRTTIAAGRDINSCAGGVVANPPQNPVRSENWTSITGDDRLLEGTAQLSNAGYTRFSYGLIPSLQGSEFPVELQARNNGAQTDQPGAIAALEDGGFDFSVEQKWFAEVLFRGSSMLQGHKPRFLVRTDQEGLLASVQIPAPFVPAGGYDQVVATVSVDSPTIGVGSLLLQTGLKTVTLGGETLSARAGGLQTASIPTVSSGPFVLNDDGVNGDLHAGNYYWTALLPDLGQKDGMHTFHFKMKLTKNGCTTERELTEAVFVDVGVDPASSSVHTSTTPTTTTVEIIPRDKFGNPWGPGRNPVVTVTPADQCQVGPGDVVDHGDGSFTIVVHVLPTATGKTCKVGAFGTEVDVPITPPTQPPVARCKNVSVDAGTTCSGNASIDDGSFDPDGDLVSCAQSPGGPFGLGANTVTLTCVDSRGATASCTGIITVVDKKAPTFTSVPGAKTVSDCSNPNIGQASATDNCSAVSVKHTPTVFPLGTTTVTWTATDAAGNVATATQLVTATLGDDPSCCPSGTKIILGTSGSDNLVGTSGRDCILGRGGDDIIDGRDGDDFISGGAGRDNINAGNGNDLVEGGDGDDTIDTGAGNDRVNGGAGRDTIMAGTGSDNINGGADVDTCFLSPDGNDVVLSCEVR
jgi:hypothetical protein